ncbi:unnamed protein product [Ascophyllum nodosum]
MVHVRTGSVDDMDSDEDFGTGRTTEWLPPTSLTERERLLRRLHEVKRFNERITGELDKDLPCGGAVSRELLELELGALKKDRVSTEKKLELLAGRVNIEDADLHYGIGSITFAADFIESQSAGSNQQSRAANCQSALNGGDGYYVTAWSSRGAGRDGLDRGVHSVASEDNTFEGKTVHRPTEVELSAQTWPGVYMKRMRHIDYPTFGSRTPPVPSSHGSNGRSPPLRKAERDEVDNMGQRRSELHVEQRYSSACPPESDKRNWGWISPPFTPETENVALHRSRGRDRGPDHGRRGKGPFRLPMASSSGSDVFATDMHDVQYRGTYPRSRQPPTYETWTAYGGDSQLDEVAVDSVQRVGRRGSPSSDLDPLHLPFREDRARFVKLVSECRKRRPGDWSKSEEGSTAGGKYKNWPRTIPTAMTTDARHERGGASSVNYGRNSDSRVWGTRNEDFHLPDTLPARSRFYRRNRSNGRGGGTAEHLV